MRVSRRPSRVLAVLAAAFAVGSRPTSAQLGPNLQRAAEAITGMDFDDAHRELDGADTANLSVALELGRLAPLRGEVRADAVALLSRPDVSRTEAGGMLADIARGCARVMAANVLDREEGRGVEVYYQDESDRALTPVLTESVERARATLGT